MTGPEHYREMEQLIEGASSYDPDNPAILATIALAQVHATAALTAATAEAIAQKDNGRSPKHDNTIAREWTEAIS